MLANDTEHSPRYNSQHETATKNMKCHYCIAVLVFSQVFVFDNFPNFFDHDIDHIREVLEESSQVFPWLQSPGEYLANCQLRGRREGGREG